MYLKRKIDSYLKEWKLSPLKKPLMVKGARQIGKTESILDFARKNYENVVAINFFEEPKYREIVADGYSVDGIVKNITRIDPSKKFVAGKTLIFFDELQDFPEIATSLKFFAIDGRYDVICSGSLLGINYGRIESNSVGYKTDYEMFSLDFEEFLWAKGYGETIADEILARLLKVEPFGTVEEKVFNDAFLDYVILGGMPSVVKAYVELKSFEGSLALQRQLVEDYKEDVRKYASGVDQTRILNVFNAIVPQLGKENKKFQVSKVAKGARFADYRGCVEWLADAGVVNLCYCMTFPELPLKGNYDYNKFKIYFADTGLLVSQLDDEAQEDLRVNKNLGVYKGALYENAVAEALKKQGASLAYYRREDSSLEEDFFLRDKNGLVPVEVKASNNTSKSLVTMIDSDKYPDVRYGVKLVRGSVGFNGKFYTFPHFCAFLLGRWLKEKSQI